MSSTSPNAVVKVQVTLDPDTGLPVCAPNPVPVTLANTLIVFELAAEGHKFPATQAVVVNDPGDDFPYACWRIDAHTVGVFDAGDDNIAYHYTVTVVDTAGAERVSVDPLIDNHNRGDAAIIHAGDAAPTIQGSTANATCRSWTDRCPPAGAGSHCPPIC